jgi:4-hydroxy-tetrahydrodipicolinate reductase
MGQILVRCAARIPTLKLAAAIDQPSHPAIGQDAGSVAGLKPLDVPISDNLQAVSSADVSVDFTLPSATASNVAAALRAGKPLIIGTTGLGDKEKTLLREASRTIPIVCAPNMSLGVNLLFATV